VPSETPTPAGTDATDLSGDSPAALSGAGLFASGFGR
jgi:hypothetical protein